MRLALSPLTLAIQRAFGASGPSLDLNFLSGTVDPRITFTRASAATRVNASGLIETVGTNTPRIDYDPVTLQPRGLLIEEQRSNELLQSDTLSTQSVTVTAAVRTLSFYGTGTVALSGAHTATVVGSGAYPTRTTLTFTPTAGTLTLTVTGSVRFAQLEVGAFATSYIPTATAQATRAADIAVMTGANFSSWFNAAQGTLFVEASTAQGAAARILTISDGSVSNQVILNAALGARALEVYTAGSFVAQLGTIGSPPLKNAVRLQSDNFAVSVKGDPVVTDTSGSLAAYSQANLGANAVNANAHLNGHIRRLSFYPRAMSAAELQALTA